MLRRFRARCYWPRAIALTLTLALTYGLVHSHTFGGNAGEAAVAAATEHAPQGGHQHDDRDSDEQQALSHCAFCAVFAGKFYLPEVERPGLVVWSDGIRFADRATPLHSAAVTAVFRPPITTLIAG